jgi:cell fate (sporulation/competence/biofilm development) regulator YlbF (YheA/YmcA/DUF963 family)
METIIENGAILQKTKELCQAILEQSDFGTMRKQIDAFMADEKIKTEYQELSDCGTMLQHKQQVGSPVDMTEIAKFEQKREAFLNNPVAQGFLDAQQVMHNVRESVNQYVSKTFELGRLPQQEDFDNGSCGHGCGCQH